MNYRQKEGWAEGRKGAFAEGKFKVAVSAIWTSEPFARLTETAMGLHAAGRREQLFPRKQLRGTHSYRTQVKLQLLFLCRLSVRRARSQGRRPSDLRSREKSMLCAEYFSSRFSRPASLAELVALAKQGARSRGGERGQRDRSAPGHSRHQRH